MPASQAGRRRFDSGRPLQRRRGVAGRLQPRVRVDAALVRAFTLSFVRACQGIPCRLSRLGSSLTGRRPDSRLDVIDEVVGRWTTRSEGPPEPTIQSAAERAYS